MDNNSPDKLVIFALNGEFQAEFPLSLPIRGRFAENAAVFSSGFHQK